MMKKTAWLILWSLVLGIKAFSQCATTEFNKNRQREQSNFNYEQQFEEWIKEKSDNRRGWVVQEATYTIPVVFHIIHNGEAEGQGLNISEQKIREQIRILNADFQRKNADTVNTPAVFKAVAGGMDIEFVLARQTPEGVASDGIIRVNGEKSAWDLSDDFIATDATLKALSRWPSENYFNIWVTNIVYNQGSNRRVAGYAQLPYHDRLDGVESRSSSATDGVVMSYTVIGSSTNSRSCVHEVGHYLGLLHPWGDVIGCNSDGDYVNDTPEQSEPTPSSCPNQPLADCGGMRMFQNYMDYTRGTCQNLFTKQQVERMSIILNNSPRRKSLLSSRGVTAPVSMMANNLGIRKIIKPEENSCGLILTPRIEVTNYGPNPISSARIQLSLNGSSIQTKNFNFDPALILSAVDTLSYDNVVLPAVGEHTLTFTILQTNNTADADLENNTLAVTTTIPPKVTIPFLETFDDEGSKWGIQNPDQLITWRSIDTENDDSPNKSMYINFTNYPRGPSSDRLISPILNFSESNVATPQSTLLTSPQSTLLTFVQATLTFDWFYAMPPDGARDTLRVVLTSGCNTDLSNGVELFNQSGQELVTTPAPTLGPIIPSSLTQWKTVSLALPISGDDLQIVFEGKNGNGQDVYIDNVSVSYYTKPVNTSYTVYNDPTFKDIRVMFNLNPNEEARLQVYDLLGKRIMNDVFSGMSDQNYIIPMENQQPGIYMLRIQLKDRVETTRIFVNPN